MGAVSGARVAFLCLGEILVDRIGDLRTPGGAPANVACHLSALGEDVALVSRVGRDTDGEYLAAWLRRCRVNAEFLQYDDVHPTGLVTVLPGPSYEIAAPAAWDFIGLTDDVRIAAVSADVLVFGSLAQRHPDSRRAIRSLVEAARAAQVPAICDLNLRAPFVNEDTVLWCLRNCDLLKLNRDELQVVSCLLRARGDTEDLFSGLLREFGITRGVLTDGANGAWFFEDGALRHHAAERAADFSDAVGAGDAFSAVLAIAVSRHLPLQKAAAPAAALAAFVVSQSGATPEIPAALAERINAMLVS